MVGAPEGLLTVLFRFVLIGLLAIVVPRNAMANELPWSAWTGTPTAKWTHAQRVWLPQSKTRVASAKAAMAAQQAFFNGKGVFEVAFPEYSQANLDDPLVIRGLLAMLDERGEARARLRQQPVPDVGKPEREAQVLRQYRDELDTLDAVDAFRRRLLLSVRSHLSANPSLTKDALQPLYDRWAAEVQRVSTLEETSEAYSEALLRAGSAEQEAIRLRQLVEALRIRSLTLKELDWNVRDERERLTVFETYEGAAQRLKLLRPVLDEAQQREVELELERLRWEQEERVAIRDLDRIKEASALRKTTGVKDELVPVWKERLATFTQQLTEVQGRLDSLDEKESAERTVLQIRLEALSLQVEDAKWVLAALTGGGDVDQRANDSQNKTEQAQKEAEAAQQAAKSAQGKRTASLLRYRKEALQSATDLWQRAKAVEDNFTIRDRENREQLDAFIDEMDRLERAGFLLGGDLDPDQTYVEVRALLRTLRASSNTFGQDLLDAQDERELVRKRVSEEMARVKKERRDADTIAEMSEKMEEVLSMKGPN